MNCSQEMLEKAKEIPMSRYTVEGKPLIRSRLKNIVKAYLFEAISEKGC